MRVHVGQDSKAGIENEVRETYMKAVSLSTKIGLRDKRLLACPDSAFQLKEVE